MSDLHKEIHLETEICDYLADHGWLYEPGDAHAYDRGSALFPADVAAWVKTTQPTAWETLEKNHGAQALAALSRRLRDSLDQRGTLDVLRYDLEMIGLRQPLALAQFKPALAMNRVFWSVTRQTGCGWCARCAIRCITKMPSIWCRF
jgi:type I restriction enzyme R subunit